MTRYRRFLPHCCRRAFRWRSLHELLLTPCFCMRAQTLSKRSCGMLVIATIIFRGIAPDDRIQFLPVL